MTTTTLTVAQVAARMGVTRLTVQKWLRDGRIAGVKLPGRAGWRVQVQEVERAIHEGLRAG